MTWERPQLAWGAILMWCRRLVFLLPLLLPSTASPQGLQKQVEAAYLCKFLEFVEWPAVSSAKGFRICVLADEKLWQALQSSVPEKTTAGAHIAVQKVSTVDESASCQIVFIGARGTILAQAVKRLKDEPVLTVSDSPDFAEAGGIITFHLKDSRVCFEVRQDQSVRVGLKISSHLLKLSRSVN